MKKSIKLLTLFMVFAIFITAFTGCKTQEVIITGAKDLVGKKIGVQEGTTGDDYVTEEIKNSQPQRFKKAVDAATDLKNGKVDAVVLDEEPAKAIVAVNDDLVILKTPLTKEEYAIAVRKEDTALLAAINKTIARIKADGTYDKFLAAFLPKEGVEPIKLPARPASNFKGELVMGTNAEFEPFEYNDNGAIVGFDVEVANEIANDMGKKLRIEDMAFDSLISALKSGKVDMVIAGMSVTKERLKEVSFSDAYYSAAQVIIIRKTSVEK